MCLFFSKKLSGRKKSKSNHRKCNCFYHVVRYCLYQFTNRTARGTKTVKKWKACAKYAVKLLIYSQCAFIILEPWC